MRQPTVTTTLEEDMAALGLTEYFAESKESDDDDDEEDGEEEKDEDVAEVAEEEEGETKYSKPYKHDPSKKESRRVPLIAREKNKKTRTESSIVGESVLRELRHVREHLGNKTGMAETAHRPQSAVKALQQEMADGSGRFVSGIRNALHERVRSRMAKAR